MTKCAARSSLFTSLSLLALLTGLSKAVEPPTFTGPAMGTTYRVTLAEPVAGYSVGELHREVDRVLARIDASLSTWRDDSDASRVNAAGAGEWIAVDQDLARVVAIAQSVHRKTGGRFDITVGPLAAWWRTRQAAAVGGDDLLRLVPPADLLAVIGSDLVTLRPAAPGQPACIAKQFRGVQIDLSAIGPGYAVDRIGDRLLAVGSAGHLVELGGEVRAWGRQADGSPWRVAIDASGTAGARRRVIELAAGAAVAVAELVPTRPVIDPRTGRPGSGGTRVDPIIRAESCAEADALATAALLPE